MGQRKGHTGNLNGRPKGTPNKLTSDLRESIKTFLDDNFKTIQEDFLKLDPVQRCQFYERLLKFAVPVMSSQEVILNYDDLTESQIDDIINRLISKQ